MSKPLNSENEKCNRCNKPTIPLFANGLKRWCPDCESDKKELPEIGSPKDKDETTVKTDGPYGWKMWPV